MPAEKFIISPKHATTLFCIVNTFCSHSINVLSIQKRAAPRMTVVTNPEPFAFSEGDTPRFLGSVRRCKPLLAEFGRGTLSGRNTRLSIVESDQRHVASHLAMTLNNYRPNTSGCISVFFDNGAGATMTKSKPETTAVVATNLSARSKSDVVIVDLSGLLFAVFVAYEPEIRMSTCVSPSRLL